MLETENDSDDMEVVRDDSVLEQTGEQFPSIVRGVGDVQRDLK